MAGGEEDVYPSGAGCCGETGALTGGRRGRGAAFGALLACLLTLWLFWPGIALYDSVDQYGQVLSGTYSDWHPPIMARLWSVFAAWWPGGAPMLLIQVLLYWLGLGLLASACARHARPAAAWSLIGIGLFFLSNLWLGALLKDAQMVGAMLAGTGLLGWFSLKRKPRPLWARAAALLLFAYAVLVRANALFAVLPLAFALLGRGWTPTVRIGGAAAAMIALIVLAPAINHHLLGAEASGVEKSLMVYDLAATTGSPCYSSRQWDEAGEPGCPGAKLLEMPVHDVARLWTAAILAHPLAYARHRLVHFDQTMRWIVANDARGAVSPVDPQPNDLGLGGPPRAAARALHRMGIFLSWLPVSWPAFWLAIDMIVFWAALAAEGEMGGVALALSLSALVMGASFLVVSVASDLRYHLWMMIASAVALVLLAAGGALHRRHLAAGFAVGLLVAAVGLAARLSMPPPV